MVIRWGYNNVQIKKGDEWKVTFITKCGLFEPLVMFFGLCNAPTSFQRMINIKFKEVLDSGCIFIYMDDIIILGDTLEELRQWTKRVLKTMRKHKLSCEPVKCQFENETVKYLGTIISHGQLSVNPSKVKAIADWPIPRKLRNVQSFPGSMNFWRKFIPRFSHIAQPLNDLLQLDRPFEWTPAHQDAFDTLKDSNYYRTGIEDLSAKSPFLPGNRFIWICHQWNYHAETQQQIPSCRILLLFPFPHGAQLSNSRSRIASDHQVPYTVASLLRRSGAHRHHSIGQFSPFLFYDKPQPLTVPSQAVCLSF